MLRICVFGFFTFLSIVLRYPLTDTHFLDSTHSDYDKHLVRNTLQFSKNKILVPRPNIPRTWCITWILLFWSIASGLLIHVGVPFERSLSFVKVSILSILQLFLFCSVDGIAGVPLKQSLSFVVILLLMFLILFTSTPSSDDDLEIIDTLSLESESEDSEFTFSPFIRLYDMFHNRVIPLNLMAETPITRQIALRLSRSIRIVSVDYSCRKGIATRLHQNRRSIL